jgi:hypothetical protein
MEKVSLSRCFVFYDRICIFVSKLYVYRGFEKLGWSSFLRCRPRRSLRRKNALVCFINSCMIASQTSSQIGTSHTSFQISSQISSQVGTHVSDGIRTSQMDTHVFQHYPPSLLAAEDVMPSIQRC